MVLIQLLEILLINYNDASGNKGKGHCIWDKFVLLSLNKWLLKNGYLCYIHPSSWRQINNKILDLFKKKQLIYLEIHNIKDGIKIFNCSTRYDWYILENIENYKNSTIKDEEGIINNINLKEWEFIPNMLFNKIIKLIEIKNNNLHVIRDRSLYSTEKLNLVKKIKDDVYKYPLIYTINKKNELTLRYTNNNSLGHFGYSKFIFSNGAGFHCDFKGVYGLTEWAYCIYDKEENLNNIYKTFNTELFKKIKNAIQFIQLDSQSYNIKVMKLFKQDFWKEFI